MVASEAETPGRIENTNRRVRGWFGYQVRSMVLDSDYDTLVWDAGGILPIEFVALGK